MRKVINEICKIVKKHDNISVFVYFFMILSVYIYAVYIGNGDELWNFSFIHKMADGYTIYKELNVIITPLFHYIGKFLFIILGNNYLTFRIYNILIFSTFYTLIYNIFKRLQIKKTPALLLTFFMVLLTRGCISCGANYNILAMIFVLSGIYIEISNKENIKRNIAQGLILFFIFMSKQNIFIFYSISLFLLYIIKMKINKQNIKHMIKKLLIIGITFCLAFGVYICYLKITNTLFDFISYCFLGINEFASYNIKIGFEIAAYCIISIAEIIISIILIKLKINKKELKYVQDINLKMLPFEVMMLFVIYPIANEYHMILGSIISIIMILFNLYSIVINEIFNTKKTLKIMKILVFIFNIIFIIYNIFYLVKYINYRNNYNNNIYPYDNLVVVDKLKEKIDKICNYVEENEKNGIDVKIISHEATLYMNVLNKNNKNMDLPFVGNLGKAGEDGLISQVEDLKEGTKILISKEKFWQESDKLRNFIMSNYNKIDEIEDFYIYQK